MKKIHSIVFFLLGSCLFAQKMSDSTLASEMISAYNSGFYPGVVRYADEILSEGSKSVYSARAYIYKAESLFKMERVDEALNVLESAREAVKDNKELSAEGIYWLGRCNFYYHKNQEALLCFYECAKALKNNKNEKEIYDSSIFFLAEANKALGNYKNACDCYEYVVQNGKCFSQNQYEQSCMALVECLLNDNQFEKAEKYSKLLRNAGLSNYAKYKIILDSGKVFEGQNKYKDSYECYIEVLEKGPVSLASQAMVSAYSVSSKYPSYVQQEPGKVILRAQNLQKEKPQLVSEFWVRLAIDAFNYKDYEKSIQYFNNSQEGATKQLKQISLLYKTEISFLTSKTSIETSAKNALAFLDKEWKNCGFEEGKDFYSDAMSLRSRYCGLCEDWENCLKYSLSVLNAPSKENSKKTAVYWASLSYYSNQNYEECSSLLSKYSYTDDDFLLLKAKSLAKQGKSAQADQIFYALIQKGSLNNDGRLDYTRTLLNAGHLISTVEQAENASGAEAEYMKGLALFNRKKWAQATEAFNKAMTGKDLDGDYVKLSRFYLGYSQYQLGEYSKAYTNLYTFTSLDNNSSVLWDCCVTAARAAVQTGKYREAIEMAKKAVVISKTENQKQESVLLTAEIHSDAGNYDQAIDMLQSYASQKNSFGYQCKYLTAQYYVQKNMYKRADELYLELSKEKNAQSLCEEAAFRRGELCYTNKEFAKAIELFEEYSKNYYKGQFYIASLYFAADSLVKINKTDKAILYFLQIVNDNENSTYKYGSEKQLIELYRQAGDYTAALDMAQRIINEYEEQSSKDGIPLIVKDLRALNSGRDSKLLKKENEYEKNGGLKTVQGRNSGTELAQLYYNLQTGSEKAQRLAEDLLKIQKDNEEESSNAAKNAVLLANIYRGNRRNKEAAEMYLQATQFYRKLALENEAARSLYGAAEAFDAANMKGDAKSTADLLKKLYPSSSYAKEVEKIIK